MDKTYASLPRRAGALLILTALTAMTMTAFSGTARAQQSEDDITALVDDLVRDQLEDNDIPGAAVAVTVGGESVLERGYGLADLETETPFGSETPFLPASVTKLFTTAAALRLVEAGDLDLDADVNDHLSGFSVDDTYPGRPVTLRHLLSYTSGFDDDVYRWADDENRGLSLAEFARKHEPGRVRPPGETSVYNNYDFVLAGLLVEEASGEQFETYLADKVFAPLGMDDTRFAAEGEVPSGHRPSGNGQAETAGHLSPVTPTGAGLVSTAADMNRFMASMLSGGAELGLSVAPPMMSRQFTIDDRMPGTGFGFREATRNGRTVWFKSGDLPGFHNAFALVPDLELGVHIVFNGDGRLAAETVFAANELVDAVIDHFSEETAASEDFAVRTDLSRYEGRYVPLRSSESNFTRMSLLFSPVVVTVEGDKLATSGLSPDPAVDRQRWVPTGDGLFREENGTDTLFITTDGTLVHSANSTEPYRHLSWFENPAAHAVVLLAGLLALLVGLIVSTIAIVRGIVHRHKGALTWALRLFTWSAGAVAAAFLILTGLAMADENAMMESVLTGSPLLTAMTVLASVLLIVTPPLFIAAAASWFKSDGRARGMVGHSLPAVGALGACLVLVSYNVTLLGV
ncbi:serine hydrolase domain-containing protein [Salininema proteolyticum]|uniref:Serine hydrolase domain-containing protein n=1 Tax=Salininema proteolyticum TaxID=1607685 RepID=A0ABV8U5V3_9ACTN